ncbi:MAG: helix-turn-helix domain-containing protein [Coleofasciculus sp.]
MMIKTEKQYHSTQEWLHKFEHTVSQIENNETLKADPRRQKFYRDSYQSQVVELREQIMEYETLTTHDPKTPLTLNLEDINDLPLLLIKARMAAKLSQKELADLAGLEEAQIQEYEENDYETASFIDVMSVFYALDITVKKGEFIVPLDTLRRTPITQEELLSKTN